MKTSAAAGFLDLAIVIAISITMQTNTVLADADNNHDKAESASASASALLMVDVQNCFCEAGVTSSGAAGSLSVDNTTSLIPVLNSLREDKACLFDSVVRSQDFHPADHISFGPTHGLDPFSHLAGKGELPLRCVSPTSGLMTDASCCPTYHVDPASMDCEAQLCPATATNAVVASPACSICRDTPEECFDTTQAMWTSHCLQDGDSDFPATLTTLETDVIVQKGSGAFVDAYSAFADNTQRLWSDLDNTLTELGVTNLYVVGIATDYCVYYSVLDALALGYTVVLIEDATRGIAPETVQTAVADMAAKGASIVTVADVMAMECPAVPTITTVAATTTEAAAADTETKEEDSNSNSSSDDSSSASASSTTILAAAAATTSMGFVLAVAVATHMV